MAWEKTPTQRSYRCNGDLLRQRRRQRGWTQEELAEVTKFSVRLIAKAEAGGNVHPDTAEVLASTLSTPEIPLFPEDLVTHPKELALEFVQLLKTHQSEVVSQSRHILADDVRLVMPGNPEVLPFAGDYVGIDEVDRACRLFFETLECVDLDSSEVDFAVCEGQEVLVGYRMTGQIRGLTAKGIHSAIPMLVINRMRFSRGRICLIHDYFQESHAEKEALAQKALLEEAD
jgi:transcriptional regulator with XRE-family HTH domain